MNVWVLTAMLIVPGNVEELILPTRHHGPVSATLAIQVAEQTSVPGTGRVRYRLMVEGPRDLRIDGLWLDDALSAWRTPIRTSSFAIEERAHWEYTMELVQTKPGSVPLPGIRIKVNAGGTVTEESWPTPLHDLAEGAGPVTLDPPPPSPWPDRLRMLGIIMLGIAGAAVLMVIARRLPGRHMPSPSAVELALAEIDRVSADGHLASAPQAAEVDRIVRGYLGTLGVPAGRATRGEIVSILGSLAWITEPTRSLLDDFLARGEQQKFAGTTVPAGELSLVMGQAREVITALAREETTVR